MKVVDYIWHRDSVRTRTDSAANSSTCYVRRPSPEGGLISEKRSNTISFHHYDVIGSTSAETDDTQMVTATSRYSAYGSLISRTGSSDTDYEWIGRSGYQSDSSAKLYSVRRRVFSSLTARWTSRDPADFEMPFEAYAYTHNSPLNRIDPSGLIDIGQSFEEPFPPQVTVPGPCPSRIPRKFGHAKTTFKLTDAERNALQAAGAPRTSQGFIQRVAISITLQQGTSKSLTPAICQTTPVKDCPECEDCTISYQYNFLETFENDSTDNHPNIVIGAAGVILRSHFPTVEQNHCCASLYVATVTKTIVAARVSGGSAKFEGGSASMFCEGKSMTISLGKNDGGPTVPTTKMSRRARSLAFPPFPPIDGLNFYQATRTLRADHPKCGPAIVTSSFSGYGKVE